MLNLAAEQKSWESYLKYGERMYVKRNSTIYKEGTLGKEGFYFLKKGVLKAYTNTYKGKENTIDILFNGEVFGEITVDGQPHFVTMRAFEDSIVYFLPFSKLNDLMKKDHRLRLLICDSLGKKLKHLLDNLLMQSLPAEQLLAMCILRMRKQYNNDLLPLSQQEISKYSGLTRITVYKIFNRWESEHLILVENREIKIRDYKGLEKVAAVF